MTRPMFDQRGIELHDTIDKLARSMHELVQQRNPVGICVGCGGKVVKRGNELVCLRCGDHK